MRDRYQPPLRPDPVMGRGLDAADAERRAFYLRFAADVGPRGPDAAEQAAFIYERYGNGGR